MSSSRKTHDWLLERLAQGELDPPAQAALRARLAAEGRSVDDELAALARSNQAILLEHPKETVATAIRRNVQRAEPAPPRPIRWWPWATSAALVGAMGLALLAGGLDRRAKVAPGLSDNGGTEELTRLKSDGATGPRLLVYRRQGNRHEPVRDGARTARGDSLQLAYTRAGEGLYGVLLSIDGAGRITRHLPAESAASAAVALSPAREVRLPTAYELDDAPAFERFLLVSAPEPFALERVLEAARLVAARKRDARTMPLPLPPSFRQTSIVLAKTQPPETP